MTYSATLYWVLYRVKVIESGLHGTEIKASVKPCKAVKLESVFFWANGSVDKKRGRHNNEDWNCGIRVRVRVRVTVRVRVRVRAHTCE